MNNDDKRLCSLCKISHFERNNYFHGKLMTARDFFAEQCYFNEKRWLINRMVNGWGVVCGLDVVTKENDPGKVVIKPGLAIDCCGKELLVCDDQEVEVVPTEEECQGDHRQTEEMEFYIGLEFWDCKTEAVQIAPAACDQNDKCEFNRIRDYYKPCVLSPAEVIVDHPEGLCPLTDDKTKDLQFYVCEKMMEGCPKCPELPREHAVILARVTLDQEGNVTQIDRCPYRRQVYSNQTLFDLINCFHGDMPHVTEINWVGNGAIIDWEVWTDPGTGIYDNGLKVKFDRGMNANTINRNTFLFLVRMEDPETGNYRYEHVPGTVEYDQSEYSATFIIESAWLRDVYFGYSRVGEEGGEFMVVLKGDHILSSNEIGKPIKALDGNFIGGQLPSGNGTQGGDFVSWFFVAPKPDQTGAGKGRRRKK